MIDPNKYNKLVTQERPVGGCLEDESGELHPHENLPIPPAQGEAILFAENRPQYLNALAAHKEAESFLKITEFSSLNKGLYIPSINELRYYGYHLNKAYETKIPAEQLEELKRAERHCQRASYDALELALLGTLKAIQLFNETYSTSVVTDVLKDYPALLVEVDEIKEFVASKSSDDRTEHYQECSEKLKRLKAISLQLECSRSSLNNKIRDARRTLRIQSIFITLAILGAALTALKMYLDHKPSTVITIPEKSTPQAPQSPPNSIHGRLDPLPSLG